MEKYLSRKQTAEALGKSTSWVDAMRREGRLKAVYVGRTPMFTEAAIRRFIASCDEDLVGRGRDERVAAIDWTVGNRDAWEWIESEAVAAARRGERISVRRLAEDARGHDWATRDGRPSALNNRLVAALSRLLIEDYPEVARFIERRSAAVDVA